MRAFWYPARLAVCKHTLVAESALRKMALQRMPAGNKLRCRTLGAHVTLRVVSETGVSISVNSRNTKMVRDCIALVLLAAIFALVVYGLMLSYGLIGV